MDKSASPLRRLRLSPGRRARWRRRVARRVLSFALLTSALLTVFFSTRAPAADGHLVIVAADDLTAGRILTGEDLREVAVPSQIAGALLDSRDGLVGRRLAVPVARGTPLSGAVLVPRTALEGLPSGTVAVHVGASDSRMLDLLSPGQTVRLHRVDSGLLAASGVRVLAVDPAGEAMADRGAARGLVVALTPQAADEALAGDGTFDTALRFHVLPEAS